MIIVISGPGGVGKGTVVQRLIERNPRLWLSKSWTTRARRPGESPDAYTFVTEEAFAAHADRGGFLEWVEFLDYRQGSPVPTPPEGHDVVFEIDVHGAAAILEVEATALSIFVDAPSPAEQRRRLEGRGDPEHRVAQRLEKSDDERRLARRLGSRFVVNDTVDETVAAIESLIEEHRHIAGDG